MQPEFAELRLRTDINVNVKLGMSGEKAFLLAAAAVVKK